MKRPCSLSQIGCITFIAILLIRTESGFAQSGVHRFGTITSRPDRTISLELLGAAQSAFLNYFDLYPLEPSTNRGPCRICRRQRLPPWRVLCVFAAEWPRCLRW